MTEKTTPDGTPVEDAAQEPEEYRIGSGSGDPNRERPDVAPTKVQDDDAE
ncbi:hypothetical protein M4I32_07820 [Microbacterium sp. LRZ72]|nr:hypothetical protein [Microbacterium sp. LRZ72]MDX2376705.1 hypothetical protein [Microbacterium sp. LRZ72]